MLWGFCPPIGREDSVPRHLMFSGCSASLFPSLPKILMNTLHRRVMKAKGERRAEAMLGVLFSLTE